jgi:hypothetical protein
MGLLYPGWEGIVRMNFGRRYYDEDYAEPIERRLVKFYQGFNEGDVVDYNGILFRIIEIDLDNGIRLISLEPRSRTNKDSPIYRTVTIIDVAEIKLSKAGKVLYG